MFRSQICKYLLIASFLIYPQFAQAYTGEGDFFRRIQEAKALIGDFEPRSVEEIAKEMHKTTSPEGQLQIFEAVAATYRDLVMKGEIVDLEGKKDLYDQIRMNVAFIQFGGNPNHRGARKVNRWIRQTLVKYLPPELLKDETMFFSTEDWNKGN